MTDQELNAWERQENVIEVLTSKEFGAWLYRRDKNKQKKGEWIWSPVADDGTVSGCCNKCSFSHVFIGGHTAQYNYCPNCGADMRGERG